MSDKYDYENGEEVMNGIDSDFSEAADRAFDNVDIHLHEGVVKWDVLSADYFGLDIPDREDKPLWTLHVMARAAMMGAVNHRARMLQRPWQLFIETQGVSVVKSAKSEMVGRVIHGRLKEVAQAWQGSHRS